MTVNRYHFHKLKVFTSEVTKSHGFRFDSSFFVWALGRTGQRGGNWRNSPVSCAAAQLLAGFAWGVVRK